MPRPKKPRLFNGIPLEENLYTDVRKRHRYWRYCRPDGSFKTFQADTVQSANEIASQNNAQRDSYVRGHKIKGNPLLQYVNEYIREREKLSPGLKTKDSWAKNRVYHLRQFATSINLDLPYITRETIMDWWNTLSHHQQKARHCEFRKLCNYLMGRGLLTGLKFNPFTLNDDRPRFYVSEKPKRQTERLDRDGFWHVYAAAGELEYPALQIAMGISLTTFMREADICTLLLSEHLENDLLKKVIGKSLEQKGNAKAARLQWDVRNYDLLRQLIQRARELSMKNAACPYVISHWPEQKRLGNVKTHVAQVLPRRLISMFSEARELAGLPGKKKSGFHCVRALANFLALEAKYSEKQIQTANAHSSVEVQKVYQDGHDNLPYVPVDIQFDEAMIGGNFK